MALRARAGGGVGGERVRVELAGAVRVAAGAGEEHPERVGQRGDRADRGPRTGCPAALLEGDGGRQPRDHFHLGVVALLDQPAGVGRHGLEVAALGLGVDGPEGQRGLAGAGNPGERDDRVAGHVHVHVPQVVLPGAAHPDKAVSGTVGARLRKDGAGKMGSMLITVHPIDSIGVCCPRAYPYRMETNDGVAATGDAAPDSPATATPEIPTSPRFPRRSTVRCPSLNSISTSRGPSSPS